MTRLRARTPAWLLSGAAVVLFAATAHAETLAAPIGGRAIAIGEAQIACREDGANANGWSVQADAHFVKPPAEADAIGKIGTVRVAPNEAACAASTSHLELVAIGPKPSADPASVTIDVDAGRAFVRGQNLRGAILTWSAAGKHGDDVCAKPDVTPADESCSFALPRDLPADPTAIDLTLLPAGAHAVDGAQLFDGSARRTGAAEYAIRAAQVSIARLVAPDAAVDVSSGEGRLHWLHPEAIASVECIDATCLLDGRDLVARGEHGADDKLDIRVQLRPRVVLKSGSTQDTSALLDVPIQRCPATVVSAPPLAGQDDQRLVVRLGAACASGDGELTFATSHGSATVERSESIGGDRYVVLHVAHVDSDGMGVRIRRRGTIVGVAPVVPARLPPLHAAIEIPERGAIDFIPTNRWVRIHAPSAMGHGTFEPIAVEGAYVLKRDAKGDFWIRAAEGASGAALLRFALVDPSLPASLRDTRIVEVGEPVERALRPVNVPVALGTLARANHPFLEVVCGDGEGHRRAVAIATTTFLPYRARDTCELVIHREQLQEDDGAQALQLTVQVTAADGSARSEARTDRTLVLKHGDTPMFLSIAGAASPFDRVLVRAALADDDTHYAVHAPEGTAAQVQWAIVMGTDRFRLYGTATIPTGLFRVADTGHSGILTLSVGAIVRAVLLSREGTEFPVGLEAGVMWLGIAGDTDTTAASHGAVAIVAGPSIAVPIANVSRSTQASINLHAWFEYEVSRTVLNEKGQPFGFVFGPSISIGDVGTNF